MPKLGLVVKNRTELVEMLNKKENISLEEFANVTLAMILDKKLGLRDFSPDDLASIALKVNGLQEIMEKINRTPVAPKTTKQIFLEK